MGEGALSPPGGLRGSVLHPAACAKTYDELNRRNFSKKCVAYARIQSFSGFKDRTVWLGAIQCRGYRGPFVRLPRGRRGAKICLKATATGVQREGRSHCRPVRAPCLRRSHRIRQDGSIGAEHAGLDATRPSMPSLSCPSWRGTGAKRNGAPRLGAARRPSCVRLDRQVDRHRQTKSNPHRRLLCPLYSRRLVPRHLEKGAVGQFSPGTAGGLNAGVGFESDSRVNPWDFVFTVEGALVFAAAAVRRHAQDRTAAFAFPFTTRTVGAGSGATAIPDEADSRAEFWAPLWSRATRLEEMLLLMSEGRAVVDGGPAHDGLDFATGSRSTWNCTRRTHLPETRFPDACG